MMTAELPADTRMMGIVHAAFRRDLARVRLVLTAMPVPQGGMLLACRAAAPVAAAATRPGPSRWTTHSPPPVPARTITTSNPRVGAAAPAAGKAAY